MSHPPEKPRRHLGDRVDARTGCLVLASIVLAAAGLVAWFW